MNDFDEVPSQMELLASLMGSIEDVANVAVAIEGTALLKVKIDDADDLEFAVIAKNQKSARYAAALLATGNRQLAATVVTEH